MDTYVYTNGLNVSIRTIRNRIYRSQTATNGIITVRCFRITKFHYFSGLKNRRKKQSNRLLHRSISLAVGTLS